MSVSQWLTRMALFAGLVCGPAFALPTQVEADMLMQEIGAAMKAGHYEGLAEKFQRIADLKAQTSDSFEFHWGRVLHITGQHASAMAHLDRYLSKIGGSGKYYVDALELYASAKVGLQREQARIAREAELAEEARRLQKLNEQIVQKLGSALLPVPGWNYDIGRYEVTQSQWRAVVGSDPVDLSSKGCDDCPVDNVSWSDVQAFLKKLNAMTSGGYRLPTDHEWLNACRAGLSQTWCGGDDLDALAWHEGNAGNAPHAVGTRQPNLFGLYDMSGNVSEWVDRCESVGVIGRETYNCYMRGGNWSMNKHSADGMQMAWAPPATRYNGVGFRVARDAPDRTRREKEAEIAAEKSRLDQISLDSANRYEFLAMGAEVKDRKTGLVWARCSVGQSWNGMHCAGDIQKYDFSEAQKLSKDGWRLPTIEELASLIHCERGLAGDHACDGAHGGPTIWLQAFPDLQPTMVGEIGGRTLYYDYWSATNADQAEKAMGVRFSNGSVESSLQFLSQAVRLIRMSDADVAAGKAKERVTLDAEQARLDGVRQQRSSRYELLLNGAEVKDKQTNLIWARCSVGQTWDGQVCVGTARKFTFDEAQELSSGAWRVPALNELLSLVYCSSGVTKSREFSEDPTIHTEACLGQHDVPLVFQSVFSDTGHSPQDSESSGYEYWASTQRRINWHTQFGQCVNFYDGAYCENAKDNPFGRLRVRLVRVSGG